MLPHRPCRSLRRSAAVPAGPALLLTLLTAACGAGDPDPARAFENLEIRVEALEGREVVLRDREAALPEERISVVLDDLHLTGVLDRADRPVSAGILHVSVGGNPTATEMLVAVQDEGTVRYFGSMPIGGPMRLEGLRFQEGAIVVDLLRPGLGDAPCCPSVRVQRRFRLDGEELVDEVVPPEEAASGGEVGDAVEPAPGTEPGNPGSDSAPDASGSPPA